MGAKEMVTNESSWCVRGSENGPWFYITRGTLRDSTEGEGQIFRWFNGLFTSCRGVVSRMKNRIRMDFGAIDWKDRGGEEDEETL